MSTWRARLRSSARTALPYYHIHATGAAAREWLPKNGSRAGSRLCCASQHQVTEYIYDMADRMAAAIWLYAAQAQPRSAELCMLGRRRCLCHLRLWRRTTRRKMRARWKRPVAAGCCSKRMRRPGGCMMRCRTCSPTGNACAGWGRMRQSLLRMMQAKKFIRKLFGQLKTITNDAKGRLLRRRRRKQKTPEQQRRRANRRQRFFHAVGRVLFIGILVAAAILALTIFFKVNTISVEGAMRYSAEEIVTKHGCPGRR